MLPLARSVCSDGFVMFSAVSQHRGLSCLFTATHTSVVSKRASGKIPSTFYFQSPFRCFSTSATICKGHNKWSNIKNIKAEKDNFRSQRISYYLKKARVATKADGGFDMKANKKLSDLEREYSKESLPLDTLKNFLQKLKDKPDISLTYQLTGPSGSLFVVEMEGESRNKMMNMLVKCLNKLPDFKLTDALIGVEFEEKGVVTVNSITKQSKLMTLEEMEEIGIELECEEVVNAGRDEASDSEKFDLICDPNHLYQLETKLAELDFEVLSAETQMLPLNERVSLSGEDGEKVEQFMRTLGELEYVKQIYDNMVEDDSADLQKSSAAS